MHSVYVMAQNTKGKCPKNARWKLYHLALITSPWISHSVTSAIVTSLLKFNKWETRLHLLMTETVIFLEGKKSYFRKRMPSEIL